jgi:hypothetical protein
MDLNIRNAKYVDWLDSATWDNCLLGRKSYGEFLINYLAGEKEGFVLNLDGAWGTGKTELLKRLYTDVLNKNHPAIYINAWESDFTNNPLLVVASELLTQLQALNENIGNVDGVLSDIKKKFGIVVKASLLGVATYASKQAFDEGAVLAEPLKELMGMSGDVLLSKAREGYQEQVQAIVDIRNELGNLAIAIGKNYHAQLPVFVFVDELDRCRPSYAIELLEVIKHFFDTKNLVFIVASDTGQLSNSIRVVYGPDFDSIRYLKRFFHARAILKSPDNVTYAVANKKNWQAELDADVKIYPNIDRLGIEQFIGHLATVYGLSLRDINQIYMKFQSAVRNMVASRRGEGCGYYFNPYVLAVAIVENEVSAESFASRRNYKKLKFGKKAEKFNIVDKCAVDQFINLILASVSYTETEKYDERFDRNYIVKDFVGEEYRIDPSDMSYSNFYAGVFNNLRYVNDYIEVRNDGAFWGEDRFLIWSDYKKLVELSGMLS